VRERSDARGIPAPASSITTIALAADGVMVSARSMNASRRGARASTRMPSAYGGLARRVEEVS
jgi:hypothetical protein